MEPTKLTVTQLNMYVKSLLEGDINLSAVTLVGELSNFKNHYSSGHLYFVLKDNNASVRAVMFRANAMRVNFAPADGMMVVCRGYVSIYERDGQYQFYAENMVPFGKGDIAMEFERVKAKLEGEGLFALERKKALPKISQKVGIVTSETGAALSDILNVSSRRYPLCDIVLFPALVQGVSAAESLISALNRAYSKADLDAIIIGRGGGSAEDLSCFNDERLARKIAVSPIPIVSAVGHEVDFTICDFVADLRAPTPSAAAEMVFPSAQEIKNSVSVLRTKIQTSALSLISNLGANVEIITNKRCFKRPEQIFIPFELRLDKAIFQLEGAYKFNLQKSEARLLNSSSRLEALAPMNILERGFSVSYKDGKIVKSSKEVSVGDKITVRLAKGKLNCLTYEISEE